MQKENKKQK